MHKTEVAERPRRISLMLCRKALLPDKWGCRCQVFHHLDTKHKNIYFNNDRPKKH